MSEPIISNMEKNEYIGRYAFDSDVGYTYNPSHIEFVGGAIKLVDQGGGVYLSSAQVIFPFLSPERVRKWYNFLPVSVLNGQSIIYEIAFTNDGLLFGTNPPTYNDNEWYEFIPNNTESLRQLREVFIPNGFGNDQMAIRITLVSDTTTTPYLYEAIVTYFSTDISQIGYYTPIYTNKADVATMAGVTINKIDDLTIKMADVWVIGQMQGKGVDYTDYLENDLLEMAGVFRALCILARRPGFTFASGPIISAGADGMNKLFGQFSEGAFTRKYSAKDWCDLAGNTIEEFLQTIRTTAGSIKTRSPVIKSKNTMEDVAEERIFPRYWRNW